MSARARRRLVIALGVALVALSGCTKSAAISLSGDATAQSTTTAVSVMPVSMGQQAWCGDWGISVRSAKRVGTLRGTPAGTGNRLLVIKFDLRNGSTANAQCAASDFKLSDETDTQYTPLIFPGNGYISNGPSTVSAGTKGSFAIVYRVPSASGPFIWRFAGAGQSPQTKPAALAVR